MSILTRVADLIAGRRTEERLAQLERAVRKAAESNLDGLTAVDRRLADLAGAVGAQPTAKDLRELRQAVRGVATSPSSQPLLETLDRLASSGRPVLVGPWTGEVGFELLYWIPFVAWVRARWALSVERQVVVSRGGVASWYGRDATRYVDVLSLVEPEAFRLAVAEEKRKHRRPGTFDERVTAAVRERLGLGETDVLHPGLMYRAFAPFWADESGYSLIDQFTRPRLLEPPSDVPIPELPADYVAVRFYFSECFPETDENRTLARGVVTALAERSPVVLLNPGFRADEHTDWAPDAPGRVIGIADRVSPEQNLAVQSAVIARARAFVGTYGGYAYLAPLYRVPAVAFYSRPSFKLHHLHAAQRAFAGIGAATLMPVDVAHARVVGAALGALA